MEPFVSLLSSLLPEFESLGNSISFSLPATDCRVFSFRHCQELHSLGLSCFPKGSDQLDRRSVALIVNITELDAMRIQGCVQWQFPSACIEAATKLFTNPEVGDIESIGQSIRKLFGPLQIAAERGVPTTTSQIHPAIKDLGYLKLDLDR